MYFDSHLSEKCAWHADVKKLYAVLAEYLSIFDESCPTITQCSIKDRYSGYITTKRPKYHAQELICVLKWKTNGSKTQFIQIQEQMFELWKPEIASYFSLKPRLTTMNTQVLQSLLRSPDHRWRQFVALVHQYLQSPLFSSSRNVNGLRAILQPRTLACRSISADRDCTNAYNKQRSSQFLYAVIQETEIMGQCVDNLINNDKLIFETSKFKDEIWFQIGFDKATKGGYSESIGVGLGKFSVLNSMCCLHIPGQIKESMVNIQRTHDDINKHIYNKSNLWNSLSKKPIIITLVAYCVDESRQVISRKAHSGVVCISSHKQDFVDELSLPAQSRQKLSVKIELSQFNNENQRLSAIKKDWTNNHNGEEWFDKWELALQQIKEYDTSLVRENKYSHMCEHERKGTFDDKHC